MINGLFNMLEYIMEKKNRILVIKNNYARFKKKIKYPLKEDSYAK